MGKHGKVFVFYFLSWMKNMCTEVYIAILFLRRHLHRRSAFAVPKSSKSASYPRARPEVWQASEFMRHRKARRVRSMALSENWAPKVPWTLINHEYPIVSLFKVGLLRFEKTHPLVSGCTGFALVTDGFVARSRSTSKNAWSMVFGRSSNRSHGSGYCRVRA